MNNSEFASRTLENLSIEKLREKIVLLKKELFNLRFQKTLGELTNTTRFSNIRKDIARVYTELTKRKKQGVQTDA